jgi:oligogalacturonide transport system substrate-binding protein
MAMVKPLSVFTSNIITKKLCFCEKLTQKEVVITTKPVYLNSVMKAPSHRDLVGQGSEQAPSGHTDSLIRRVIIMKKGFVKAALTAVMAASMLAGCSSTAASSKASKASSSSSKTGKDYDECTIKLDWWGGDSRHEATLKAVEAFEKKYPGIKVETNYNAWKGWETSKALEYQSKQGADVTQINFNWIGDYDANGDVFLDLNEVSDALDLTQWDEKDLAKAKDSKGAQAAVPVSITGRTFYWNKTTFDKAGLETPKSLDDLMNAGKVFQEKLGEDYYPLYLGEYDRALFMSFWMQAQSGEPIIDEDGKLTASQEDFQKGMEFIKSLEDGHVIPTIEFAQSHAIDTLNQYDGFINGEIAGVFEWDSAINKYIKNLAEGQELVVGQELEGLGDKASGVSSKASMLFAITKYTEHPHEAALLLNFLLNEEEGVDAMGTQRGIPASKAAYDYLDKEGRLDKLTVEAHQSVLDADPMYFSPKFDNADLKGDTGKYISVFDSFSTGETDAAGAAETLYKAYQDVLGA